jgi:putative oxidoreductase
MLFAMIFHISRGESNQIGMPLLLGVFAAFVSWGRFKRVIIMPKGKS